LTGPLYHLDRAMPHFSIEGEDYFSNRDAAEKAGA
jgi:hypothetical protein